MSTSENKLPYSAEIKSILLSSFDGTRQLNILPQMVEFTLYESIFNPLMKAELTLKDEIGLFINFPLTGEEFINVSYKVTNGTNIKTIDLSFVINAVSNIEPSINARSYNYVLYLASRPAYENVRQKVSHAYHNTISDAARKIFTEYLQEPALELDIQRDRSKQLRKEIFRFNDIEQSFGTNTVIIPNLMPIDAIQWLASRAVSQDYGKNYLYTFYQTLSGFHFKTVQSLFSDSSKTEAFLNPYYYISNVENAKDKQVFNRNVDPKKSITNLFISERYSTLDKIAEGYFQNQYFEINLYQNSYKHTDNEIDNISTKIDRGKLNTDSYINASKISSGDNIEKRNRVKYAFNNFAEFDSTQSLYDFRDKWGEALRSKIGFSNIDINITIEGDTSIEAGKVIFAYIPEMHGFNIVDFDKLISGYFLVSEVKHVFRVGQKHTTVLKINKDSYGTDINNVRYRYGDLE